MEILEWETLEIFVAKWVSMLCMCVYADVCMNFYSNSDS